MKKYIYLFLMLVSIGICSGVQKPYRDWKKELQSSFNAMGIGDPMHECLQLASQMRELREQGEMQNAQELAYHYAFLLELIKPSGIDSSKPIDWQWLYDLEEELITLWHLDDASLREEGIDRTTDEQRDLLVEIKRELGITKPLAMLSFKSPGGLGTSYYIVLSSDGDLSSWLATAYHEMTHILHSDSLHRSQVQWGEASAQTFLHDPSLQEALTLSEHYISVGKKVFDDSTRIGRQIKSVLAQHTVLYHPPQNSKKQASYMLIRGQEQRADLFEFKKLLEHGYMDALWQEMAFYALSGKHQVAGHDNPWPSDIERALCVAGFLKEQGIDVKRGLQDWEQKKVCPVVKRPSESLCSLTRGARHAKMAYNRWHQKESMEQ